MTDGAVLMILATMLAVSVFINVVFVVKIACRKKYKNITELPTVQVDNVALHKVVSTFAKNYNGGKAAAVRMASRYDEN